MTEHSSALDLAKDVFTLKDPKEIALSLKHSAEVSERRKSDSAMQMLNFYVNRRKEPCGRRPRASRQSQGRATLSCSAATRQDDAISCCDSACRGCGSWAQHHLVEVLGEHRRGEKGDGAKGLFAGVLPIATLGVGSTNTLPGPTGQVLPSSR